ncbi:hypothetical protein WA026_011371 [Henosepilachna vigintioctopunctata]|uniref:PWWP domain-containing protein n=1 Tax=Henosepilachna vigintioctopunctata TaxID=420089 RepID=A0AAW1TS15_9CUCU
MEVFYKPSDIVWVKLGPFWWPGEVVDKTKVPVEIIESLKKEPVAFVKFFDDDEYLEIVKTSDHIYHYNCDRKNGFIKKGMDAFRANNPKLTTFPKDVSTAEVKTGGNANILSDPMFTPEPKKNYGEIFGSPSAKKSKNGNKNRPNKSAPIITHRRFLGCDDYKVHVLIQFPGKDKEFEDQDQPEWIARQSYAKFTCPICHFVTDKLSILTIHTQSHVKDVHIPGSHAKKTPKRKKRMALSDDENEKKTKIKRKYKKKAKTDQSSFADDERSENASAIGRDFLGGKIQDPTSTEKKDVCNDIIADWDDESNQDNTEEMDTSAVDTTLDGEMNTSNDITVNEVSLTKDSLLDSTFEPTEGHKFHSTLQTEESDQTVCPEITEKTVEKIKEKDSNVSCFDFDENEEDTRIPNATSGRKIPRVIPLSDKRKSFSLENDIVEDEEEELRKKILQESVQLARESEAQEKDEETEDLEKTYKSLMESTSNIELPDLPNELKSEQNFHCARTVKYPDKDSTAISTPDDGSILLDVAQKVEKAEENSKHSEVCNEASSNIENSNEESREPNLVEESSVTLYQLCPKMTEKPQEIVDVFSVEDVKELSEGSKIDNEAVPSIKKDASNSKNRKKKIVENKLEKQLAPKTIVRSKRKFETLRESPKHSVALEEKSDKKTQHVEIDSNNDTPKKRYKKSKVSDVENSKVIEDTFCTEISVDKQIEEKSSEHPLKIDGPESENKMEDSEKKKKKSKKETSEKKEKKEQKPVQKRHIDESEIDKLLAKYSAEPIKYDEESDYCSSELMLVISPSKSSKEDMFIKSGSQSICESAQTPDPVIAEDKKGAIEPDIQNVSTEQESSIAAPPDSNNSKQNELNLNTSQSEIIVQSTQMPSAEKTESNELLVENKVILEESSTANSVSEICSEQIVPEGELKEENSKAKVENTEPVSVKDKTSKRSSRRHKRSNEQEEDISLINSESKASVDKNQLKDKPEECDSHLEKIADTEMCEKELPVVEQETPEILVSSTANSESLPLLPQEKISRPSSKKSDRRSSKDLKKESSEREQASSNKKGFDESVTSRRSTRRDRRSSSKHDVSTSQTTTELESNTGKIDDNMSKRDDSKLNEKDALPKDPQTLSITLKDDTSSSLKDINKSEKNDKNDERHKTEFPKNLEPNSSNYKESHRSSHKSSRSRKTSSSRSNRDDKSSRKNDSVENVAPVDQIQEPVTPHRSSRSKSHHVDENISKMDEQSSLVDIHTEDKRSSKDLSLNIKSGKEDRVEHSSDKQKEKSISSISQKEGRKSSHSSKSRRRSSKHDYEHVESSTKTDMTKNERGRSDRKGSRSPHLRSKSDKASNKSSHSRGENLEISHGSSSHHNYRRSRDHSEKHIAVSKIEKQTRTNEKDVTENMSSLKTEKHDKVKRNSSSVETAKIEEKHRSYRKERRSADDYNEKKQNESKSAESGKGDLHGKQQIDKKSVNWVGKQDSESKGDKQEVTEISVLSIHQDQQEISLNINEINKEIKEISPDEKQTTSETMILEESEEGKSSESSVKDSDEKLEMFTKVDNVQEKDSISQENSNGKENIGGEAIARVSAEISQPKTIPESSFTSISSADSLSNLISAIVGADSSQELDQIKKNEGVHELLDPVCDSPIDKISSGININEKSDDPALSDLDKKINCILDDGNQPSVVEKQEVPQKSRRNRKPSRWDQKERPSTITDKKSKIGRWDQEIEVQSSQQQSAVPDIVETSDNTKTSSNIPQPQTNLNVETEKLEELVSEKDSSIVSQHEAEQIELIFGSSPLPKPQEDNLFPEEESGELKEIDTSDFVQKKDPKKIFMMKSKLTEPASTFNEKNNDKISTFECSARASDDLMESVESQVARITHYEEPQSQESEEVRNTSDEEQSMKKSDFDTPEKKSSFSKSIFDTPDGKIKVTDSVTPENKLSVDKKKRPRLLEADMRTQQPDVTDGVKHEKITPKSKKNYLLIEKSKLEKMDKSPETLTELSSLHAHSSLKSSKERANEVATKLTNPKKRFVKSFEDFELNKQKEKLVDVPSSVEDETKKESTVSGLVGKSPIVFKLKKQFLSKISNVFDEENDEMINASKPKTSTLVKSVSPIKVKELNSSIEKAEEHLGNDNVQCISNSEIEADDNKSPIVRDDASQNENSEVSFGEILSINSDKIEVPEMESLIKAETKTSQEIEMQNSSADKSNSNQVHFEIDNSSVLEFTIDTNLSNIDQSQAISEITIASSEMLTKNEEKTLVDDSKTEIITKNFPLENKNEESEFVPIEGNLTVVSEKELAEGQVEITATMPIKKPVNLMNFSMDFSDDSSDTAFEVLKKENIRCITESLDVSKTTEGEQKIVNAEVKKPQTMAENASSASELNVLHDEESLHSAIIAQLDLNFDSSAQKDDHQNITIENILETNLMKRNDAVESVSSSASLSQFHETTTSIKTLVSNINTTKTSNKTDINTAKEPEKVESITPIKRTERKTAQKPKLSTAPANEPLVIYNTVKSSTITDMCDLEDHIPSQIVCSKNALINEEVMKVAGIGNELTKEGSLPKIEPPISKLLTRLTGDKTKDESPKMLIESKKPEIDIKNQKVEAGISKNLIKPSIKGQALVGVTNTKSGNKAIILSEKIIRPARDAVLPNSQLKRSYEDIEDIKPYIISKTQKIDNKTGPEKILTTNSKVLIASSTKSAIGTASKLLLMNPNKQSLGMPKFSGKAKILNQTIIRPASEILQAKAVSNVEDNIDFDINSMPIVLSDELLTPESLENMPIVLGDNIPKSSSTEKIKLFIDKKDTQNATKLVNNSVTMPSSLVQSTVLKTPQMKKTTVPKILQSSAQPQRVIRQATSTKSGKLIFVPENSSKTIQTKKPNIVRRSMPLSGVTANPQNVTPETTGHKIMIVTNQQGQQQRLLLTPAHQKMFGMQLPKAGKTIMKSGVALKTPVGKVTTNIAGNLISSKVQGQGVTSTKFIKAPVSSGQVISPQIKLAPPRKVQKVYMPNQQTTKVHPQKTILIKNHQGQTVKKVQGTDEALLDKQVAEQIEAIKVSSLKSLQRQQELVIKTSGSKPSAIMNRKSYSKRPEVRQTLISQPKMTVQQSTVNAASASRVSEQVIPALTPIKTDKKPEETKRLLPEVKPIENKPVDRPLNQLVIQDNMGNQTTVTEGQILALPSETVDGQPQSYMLVTLDESGNLTPLNNEALMSLDPSLAGGDLSNMVLQLDPGLTKDGGSHTAQLQAVAPTATMQEKLKTDEMEMSRIIQEVPPKPVEQVIQPIEQTTAQVQVTCNINGEPSQQIILTGDPLATQKFLDSLSEGNTDLANILANAEGSSFLIQADGQQILINTEPTDAQMLQANSIVAEQPDQGNPMFATHPGKNQDILAAALADTDVFQQEQISNQNKVMHSQLSPGQTLFPMNVGNVLETSLTLNSPIMTPLEVPSTNSKKIMNAESDILSARVPKNVDLPITITDPNISQTVSHQQVLLSSDLQTNLELTLPISETAMSVTSGMNSPSFVYSLPNLGVTEHTEVNQKSFSSSMPLLTEDIEETPHSFPSAISKEGDESTDSKLSGEVPRHGLVDSRSDRSSIIASDNTYIEEGLCTLGGEMCSSLSEPPPEMFDMPISNDSLNFLSSKSENSKESLSTSVTLTPELLTDENSMEIPVQPRIVADLKDPPHTEDSFNSTTNDKECKLD